NCPTWSKFAETFDALASFLHAAKPAASSGLEAEGVICRRIVVQCSIGPLDGFFISTGDQMGQGEGGPERPTQRIERAQSNSSLERLDREGWPVGKPFDPSPESPGECTIRVDRKSPLDGAQAESALAGEGRDGPAGS